GYWLRDEIAKIDPELRIDLGFSEGLLESWAAREAFLLFCLLVDPDPPTWRAWLGYENSETGGGFAAPSRNAGAYLKLLKAANDAIAGATIEALAGEPRKQPRGTGGLALWDRARRFIDLRTKFEWSGSGAADFVNNVFDTTHWLSPTYDAERLAGA